MVPKWFFGYDIAMEIIFTLVTFAVAYYSLKVYSIYHEKSSKAFGIGFGFISASYFIWALINLFLLSEVNESMDAININEIVSLSLMGLYSYMFFYIIGISILAYLTLKVKNLKVYSLILILSLAGILLSCNKIVAFHLISAILLSYVVYFYFKECLIKHNKRAFLVLFAFIFMTLTSINLIFIVTNYYSYISGHILNLIAYGLILANLLIIKKNEQKKK
jgi:hypothetical protein